MESSSSFFRRSVQLSIAAWCAGIRVLPEILGRVKADRRTAYGVLAGELCESLRRAVVHRHFQITDVFVCAVRVEFIVGKAPAAGFDRACCAVLILNDA